MKVSIASNEDGTYTVAQDDEGMAEQQGAMPGMPEGMEKAEPKAAQGQTANSLEQALQLVVRLFKGQAGGMKSNPFGQGFQQVAKQPQAPMY